jgi:glycosyltransferase involved in cell wall biosynthesis
MKLLHIAHNAVLSSNQERLVELARLGGYDITLLTPPWNLESHGIVRLEKLHDPNFEIVRGRPLFSLLMGQRYLQYYPFQSRLIRRLNPDIIVAHEEPWSLTALQTLINRNAWAKRARLVVETEQNIYKVFPWPFGSFERAVIHGADAIVARNTEAESVVRRKGFKGPTAIVPNGLDETIFRKKDASLKRRELELVNFTIGYAGRIEKEKGLDDLLRAVARIETPIDVLIVGQGRAEPVIRALAGELHLKGRLLITPPVAQALLPDYINCMDLLVLPSRTTPTWKEQFGRVLVEAMACETPVAGSSSGAIPEVIGNAGLIFEEGDDKAIAKVTERFMNDHVLRETCVKNGLRRVRNEYSWAAVSRRLDTLYRSLVS